MTKDQGLLKVGSHPARSYPAAEKEEISSDLLSMEELLSTESQKRLHSGDARHDFEKTLAKEREPLHAGGYLENNYDFSL